ncbi:MAG: SDR family oxidoreductase [Bacillota bacterium]
MNKNLIGKIALVTGASRLDGLGAAICKKLAKNGADIYFTYWLQYDKEMPWEVKETEPKKLQNLVKNYGVKCFKKEMDLSLSENIKKLFDKVINSLGKPDILVNNAAYSTYTNYRNLTSEELDRHYKINIRATTLLSTNFGQYFDKNKGGRIINITSGQFKGPMKNEVAYATTKGAIDALTITLSAELADKGITVNAVNPGPTDTGWINDELRQKLIKKFPKGRIGKPEDAANLVNFLSTDEAEWITGQIIHSEGGFMR